MKTRGPIPSPARLSRARTAGCRTTLALAAPVLALAVGACTRSGTPRPLNAEAAALSSGPVSRGPAPPTRGLPMPSLDLAWTPPMSTAGDVEALAKALSGHEAAVVRLGARLSQRARAEALVKALDPDVAHVEDAPGGLAPLVPAADLPLRRAEQPGRPHYEWDGLHVDTTSLQRVAGSIPDAGVLVAVDDAAVDPEAWKALPARAVGSCQAPLEALAEGQERALAELEPFLDHADAVLAQMFRSELRVILPAMREELGPYGRERARGKDESAKDWRRYSCGRALHRIVAAYAACGSPEHPCPHAPRLFLQGGVRVGAVEPDVLVPADCQGVLPRDYVAEIREAGRESARMAADHLDASWVALSDRLGAVTEVHAALEDVCAPRRRRFAEEDLHTAREKLAEIGAALGSDDLRDPAATWVLEPGELTVPGIGPVLQHARYDAGPGSPSHTVVAESRALREFVLARARCRSGEGKLPLVALVVEGDDLKASFFGYFYEEELFCAELPPLRAGVTATP